MPTERPELPDPEWISEEQAHHLLGRAAEFDSRGLSDVSIAQLREAAMEAGIGAEAFEKALGEFKSGRFVRAATQTPPTVTLADRLAHYRRHTGVGLALAVALVTRGDMPNAMALYAIPLYALYEIGIAVLRSRDRSANPPLPPATNEHRLSAGEPRARRDSTYRMVWAVNRSEART